jgi:integrase
MAIWRKTNRPAVYIAHQTKCPAYENAGVRCRCNPSYRGRRRHPVTGKPIWQKATKNRAEVLTWLADAELAAELEASKPHARASYETLGDAWLDGIEEGVIGRRRGKGKPYSETTIANYRRSWENVLRPEFGPMVAEDINEVEWQMWVDQLSREGLSRSRIANHVAVASSIYAWALAPSRRFVTRNPLRMVELPPNDEKPRLRVALVPEAEQLLAALTPEDRVPYAIACCAGLRRSEIHRLEWPEVLEDGKIDSHLLVLRSKSEAGTQRRPPIAEPLQQILREAWLRQGRPTSGPVSERSVMSGKLASAATTAWDKAGLNRITLHECRHTYASMLMAAHYTLKELMEYMGHRDLQMVNRYVKLLPQPRDDDAADRLNWKSPASVDTGWLGGLAVL